MRVPDLDLEPWHQRGHDHGLVDLRVPQPRARPAALHEIRPPLVVAREQAHGSLAAPALERVGLVIRLEVRRRVQLQHRVARRHDERVRRVDRLLELELPRVRALAHEPRERREPLGLVRPGLEERCGKTHRGSLSPSRVHEDLDRAARSGHGRAQRCGDTPSRTPRGRLAHGRWPLRAALGRSAAPRARARTSA